MRLLPVTIAAALTGVLPLAGMTLQRAEPPPDTGSPPVRVVDPFGANASGGGDAPMSDLGSRVHAASLDVSSAEPAPRSRSGRADRATRAWRTTEASWYDQRPAACFDDRGRHEPPDDALWAAHRTLPCGTTIQVLFGDHALTAAIWDRGPYVDGRDLDLSRGAFARLGPLDRGVLDVRWRVIG